MSPKWIQFTFWSEKTAQSHTFLCFLSPDFNQNQVADLSDKILFAGLIERRMHRRTDI